MTQQIESLRKPLNEMTDEELKARILELREEQRVSRTHVHQGAAKAESVQKVAKKRASKEVAEMSPDQAAALLRMLQGEPGPT